MRRGTSDGKVVANVAVEAEKNAMAEPASVTHYEDMQSAPRFPLHLSASVKSQGSAYTAETENISANGVLLAMDNDVPVGSMVDFTIALPADVVGAPQNVQIDCRGRVVRSFEDRGRRGVGVVIDEYHFERA
ncbi:MAG TPA: PilZ domain-containing protein [Candidatus Sulfotelmatobacter sp.]|nr:PilZ domain-containing protein [Candidatus Sulfotelmatobacter sp.]